MNDKYILDGHTPVPVASILEWGQWFEKANRVVAKDKVNGVEVSTVFLGLDHQWGDGPPLLFETMIFGGPHDEDQWRYSTWDEAVTGHVAALKLARQTAIQLLMWRIMKWLRS